MKEKKGISHVTIWLWIFVGLAIFLNILATDSNVKGDTLNQYTYNRLATFCWIIAGIFAFIRIITKIVKSNTDRQQEQLEEQKKKIDDLQRQNQKIIELQKQIDEMKRKDLKDKEL